ncbi:MAG TPA: FAD-dependent oxidoreductase [Anaerolineae bacterium]|nr:FAD-dependent oxidoreductase [Anaerolineae bacterium]
MGHSGSEQTPNTPVGAVLVVGGGIAGMQASLDLADQGFKVYLVEAKAAIGGHMAQLDKTFPTNDCAMCTISPKLVETGRHLNIDILTNTEVLDVAGAAGDFSVRVRRQPRYIDPAKCIACGDCAKVCPIVIPDPFNEGLAPRHAAYKLYPQAVPNAYAIEKRGIAPCRDACPTRQRAQGYIALIREGRYADALRVIKEDNPFPSICGRICNHRCELACNRNLVDEPLNIHALKRFVADWAYAQPGEPIRRLPQTRPQRAAIIGAGPCGLTTAKDLIMLGYGVTVFEALPVAGGMLRVGVPEYRLPAAIVDREVQDVIDLGVDLRLNTTVNNLDDLFAQGFDAVLIAVGAHEGKKLPIPGADLPEVLVNTQFLRDVRLSNLQSPISKIQNRVVDKRVLVLGGGNVAIDCARTAMRLGAASVAMACLESREKMPAHLWEIAEAEAEGVTLHPARSFKRILDEEGRVAGVECVNVSFMEFDAEGKLALETEPNSEHVIPCDTVIFSIGQRAGLAFIPADAGVGVTRQQTIAVNPNTFAATRPGVFAAGDATTGTAFVVEAVAAGHKVAASIHRYLSGEPLEPKFAPDLPVVKLARSEIDDRLQRGEVHVTPRVPMPLMPVEQRRGSFAEVERGYTEAQARAEAARCLECGICSECLSCVFACGVNAIDHDAVAHDETLRVGAVVLAPGYQAYHAELSEEYGFGRYPNVVTALQFERLLSASGPTSGHVRRPSDQQEPRRIAFLQCIGSRDQQHDYCSAVCCMYATKEAVIAKEHHPELDIRVFMMDMRAFSKGYWSYFERARGRYGIHYTRCRISALRENPVTHNLIVRYSDSDQSPVNSEQSPLSTDHGSLLTEEFDLVVLSVGMEISPQVRELGRRLGIELDEYGFCHTAQFNPLETSRPGIYAVGPFREPKDIPESVVEASGAAAAVAAEIGAARFTLTRRSEYPSEREVKGEAPRVGVFVCHCGSNIAGFLDVPQVTAYAGTLPNVAHAESNLYTCSQDSIKHITETVKELGLNRVVVASCTPLTHQPLFQDSIRAAGLNPYLFEMANIRNQCSWVHSNDRAAATTKAADLVRMAVARAALLEPQHTLDVPVQHAALVVGGGVAGMTAALSLAEQGFPVHLVEQAAELGGNLRRVFTTPPVSPPRAGGTEEGAKDPQQVLHRIIEQVQANPSIYLHLGSTVVASSGFMGNFVSVIQEAGGERQEVPHGVTILATGAQEYRGPEYGYGTHPRIVTQQEFEALLESKQVHRETGEEVNRETGMQVNKETGTPATCLPATCLPSTSLPNSIVMIQCVGPAEKFCSRICCTVALKNALALKEKKPDAQVVILYKDIRTYGFKERLYQTARERGVIFMRYDDSHKPEALSSDQSAVISVRVWDPILQRGMTLQTDLLVLSMPAVPRADTRDVAKRFKVATDADGFFLEAHVKLRPVDFATNGVFMAGMAHYPKLLDETLVQAQAAAARAARVLSRESLAAGGRVAVVDEAKCTGCLTCVRICPFNVPKIKANLTGVGGIVGAATIEAAVCQGCGLCVAECPARAIQLLHYTDAQLVAKVHALLEPPVGFIPAREIGVSRS